MPRLRWAQPPESIRTINGDENYQYFLALHRTVFGAAPGEDGILDADNVVAIESLKATSTGTTTAFGPDGSGGVTTLDIGNADAEFILGAADGTLTNGRVLSATDGANVTFGSGTAVVDASDAREDAKVASMAYAEMWNG